MIPINSKSQFINKDIWAIGCLTLELLHGSIDKRNRHHPYNFTISELLKNNISKESANLIEQINQ